jgi:hypothetical protein
VANELVDAVTATPAGPVDVRLGDGLDVTGRFTLDGPSGRILVSRAMNFTHTSPGAPFSFGTESPVIADTDYTKTCSAASLNSIGEHTLVVNVVSTFDVPPQQTVESSEITVNVRRWVEDQPEPTTWAEGQRTPTAQTEGQRTPTSHTEGQPTPTTWAEGQRTATSWTEGS